MSAKTRAPARVLLLTAASSLLVDLPFRLIALLGLIPSAGPKNTLPLLFGLLYGPLGAAGAAAGVLLSGLVRMQLDAACILEMATALAAGSAVWLLWYRLPLQRRPQCKNVRELAALLLCVAVASVLSGVLMLAAPQGLWSIGSAAAAAEVGVSTAVWSLLLGLPCLIFAVSMFGVEPKAPAGWVRRHPQEGAPDLERIVMNDPESISQMSDAIDEFVMQRGFSPKLGYEMLSCVEELNCRIFEHLSVEKGIQVRMFAKDSVHIYLRYDGERYNPLKIRVQRGDPLANMDVLGILLVREMAVYTHHSYEQGVNRIKIIV